MSLLSDKIRDAINQSERLGVINRHMAAKAVKPILVESEKDLLVDEALAIRIKAMAANIIRNLLKGKGGSACGSAQMLMFPDLHRAYPVDHSGREIKLVGALSY